ncbi:PREDICTED: uncharacterized protein LOC104704615 [Camelina sativa]|uniref:Uncharacterized protein LOC104704615 n=1 Tax=Camelina sativa TaxID=90675 RepID=A0ABM0T0K9_CAMSA|nr:PREDICTED: uncharacterized protein LOC104704615 [Camelina sativa]
MGMPPSASQGMMPDKFDGKAGFKTWQNKMHYYLVSMNMERYLTEDPPTLPQGDIDVYVVGSMDSWAQGDYCCKGQILNRLVNDLYDLYSMYKTSKAMWQALETKYKTDESGMQKFSTTKFLNFKMVDSKPIIEQVEALQRIFQEIELEGMSICNVFKTNCLIEKLPPGWSNFKHYLNFKRKEMSLDDLIRRLRVENNNRGADSDAQSQGHDIHVAEHKAKFKGKAKDLKLQANLTEEDMVAVVTEFNMVEDNPVEWNYDTGTTTHICSDRTMFNTYEKNKSNEQW